MTTLQLTLSNHSFSFRPLAVLLWAGSAIALLVIMSAYVSALHVAVERGEALRESQRADNALPPSGKYASLLH